MKKPLFLREVLQMMRQTDVNGEAVPFSLEWRTYNKQNKMGGKLMTIDRAVLCFKLEKDKVMNWEAVLKVKPIEKERKNPNHHKNYTINIDPLIGKPIKVNVLLITKFNGQKVDY